MRQEKVVWVFTLFFKGYSYPSLDLFHLFSSFSYYLLFFLFFFSLSFHFLVYLFIFELIYFIY